MQHSQPPQSQVQSAFQSNMWQIQLKNFCREKEFGHSRIDKYHQVTMQKPEEHFQILHKSMSSSSENISVYLERVGFCIEHKICQWQRWIIAEQKPQIL